MWYVATASKPANAKKNKLVFKGVRAWSNHANNGPSNHFIAPVTALTTANIPTTTTGQSSMTKDPITHSAHEHKPPGTYRLLSN